MTPRFVGALLDWPPAWFVARLLLVSAYLFGGMVKLVDWPGAVAEQLRFGLHPPVLWAAATIGVELTGSLLILSGRLVWLGAGMLGVLTLVAGVVVGGFWAMAPGPERLQATNVFLEHLGLVGGFGLAALLARQRVAGP